MKTILALTIVTILLINFIDGFSQAALKQWAVRFGGRAEENLYVVQQTTDY